MKQICCVCKIQYGVKEPLDDDSETHGLCHEHFKLEMKKIEEYRENGIDPWKKVDPTSWVRTVRAA